MKAKHLKPDSPKRLTLKSKLLATVLSLALIVCLVFSGSPTFSWMYTAKKTDTITFGKTSLSITITDAAGQQLIPGKTYTLSANPKATVAANSVPCYLFVHVVDSKSQFDAFSYNSWTQVGSTGYYYKTVATSTSAQSFNVFTSNQVKAKDSLTHSSGTLTAGKITVNYCAIQQANLTAAEAQAQIASVI
ncbi:MAG: hypothetical protein IKU10_04330 [Clostridia bacterium]|nr:hypothetical protein [Clostridia bacterium]